VLVDLPSLPSDSQSAGKIVLIGDPVLLALKIKQLQSRLSTSEMSSRKKGART
jgi:hypothetical protein